ncbi:hypothetical protein ACWDSJ_26445 [Nocardia sp. NPDC003482]
MSLDISCPTCGYDDCVQNVPALYASGTSTVRGTDYYSGIGIASNGLLPVVGSATIARTQTTLLAEDLRFAPAQQKTTGLILWGLIAALPALVYGAAAIFAPAEPGLSIASTVVVSAAFVLVLASPSILLLAIATGRVRRNGRISRGRGAACEVWRAGFYCHRCGYAFWPTATVPGVPIRRPLLPAEFRWVVWNVGGYAGA